MKPRRTLGLLMLCLGGTCVGLTGAYVRPLIQLFEPLQIAAVRSSVSALAVLLFAGIAFALKSKNAWIPSKADVVSLLAFGVVGIFGCNGATLIAVSQPGQPGLGLTIILVVSLVVARLCERGHLPPTRVEFLLGTVLGIGLLTLFDFGEEHLSISLEMTVWSIIAGTLQGFMVLIIVKLQAPLMWRLAVGFGVAAGLQVGLCQLYVGTTAEFIATFAELEPMKIVWITMGGILTLAVAYTLLNIGASMNGSVVAAALALCLEPIAGLAADAIIAGHTLSPTQLIGATLVLFAIVFYNVIEAT